MATPRLLACTNMLLGTVNLLVLSLPDGWQLVETPVRPEVEDWTEREGCRWARVGQARYDLVGRPSEAGGWVRFELRLDFAKRNGQPRPMEQGIIALGGPVGARLGGHPGQRVAGQARPGWLVPRGVTTARIAVDCPETERTVWLTLRGRSERGLEELLAGLEDSRCH